MRKLLLILISALCVSACTNRNTKDKEFQNTYNSFVDSILDNNGVDTAEIPFAHKLEVTKESTGEYRYAITISDPKVAMYHIQMMVVDKAAGGQYPFIGLMNDEPLYSMIPNQENKEKYFVKGVVLEGASVNPQFTLYVQVNWKDYAQVNTNTAFFSYTYDYDKEHAKDAKDTTENENE